MAGHKPVPLELTQRQRAVLEQLSRHQNCSQRLVRRARIVLACADGHNNERVGELVGVHRDGVRKWRARWLQQSERLGRLELEGDENELRTAVEDVLSDASRSGAPTTFTPEQVCQILALSCEDPKESGRPVTHWTTPVLAHEAIKRGIVPTISPRSVGRFLGRGVTQAVSGEVLAKERAGPGG